MRRALVLAAGTALTLTFALTPVARAAPSPPVSHQAWARSGPLPTFVGASDRLYVAAQLQTERARAFVAFDFSTDEERKLDGAALVLRPVSGDSVLADNARIAACLMVGPLERDGEIDNATAPRADCSLRVDIERGPNGDWNVPLGVLAPAWRSRATRGVALLPRLDGPGTFRVAFDATATRVDGLGSSPPAAETTTEAAPSPEIGMSEPGGTAHVGPDAGPSVQASPSETTSQPGATVPQRPSPITRSDPSAPGGRSAATPTIVPFVAALVLGGVLLVAAPTRLRRRLIIPGRVRDERVQGAAAAGVLVLLALLPMAATELTVFKTGLVLIFLVAALGLHILVNWAGQLSLAHAGMVGVPTFVALGISEVHQISPIYLLPVAIATGAAVGGIVALPTLRAQGLQVALVTLAAGVGIDRYFFTKSWLVGPPGGRTAATPALGPWEFNTSRGLYPVLVMFVVLAAAAAWLLMHSKLARAWAWVRSDPAAAAAVGIPVIRYRILAFAVGGAFAGLAGGLSVLWIKQLTEQTFPTTLSFTYLLVAVIAGPGYIGGLALGAAVIEGGRLFSSGAGTAVAYMGPLALIFVITRYSAGINGAGRRVMERVRASRAYAILEERSQQDEPEPIGLGFILGLLSIAGGFLAIGLAWYHAGNTDEVWIQNQEIISGGFGGVGLVLLGSALLIRDGIGRAQRIIAIAPAPGAGASPARDVQEERRKSPLVAAPLPPKPRGNGTKRRVTPASRR